MRFEIEKFDGKINFGLWQVQVKDLLIQYGLHKALKGKSIPGKPGGSEDSEKGSVAKGSKEGDPVIASLEWRR